MPEPNGAVVELPAGDSAEQRLAEGIIVQELSRLVGADLKKRRIGFASGSWIEVDGCSDDPPILCEAWAHIGPPKGGQKHKVMTDGLKLVVGRDEHFPGGPCRAILAFCDEEAAELFRGKSWMAQALQTLNVEVVVVPISADQRRVLLQAQKRQFR